MSFRLLFSVLTVIINLKFWALATNVSQNSTVFAFQNFARCGRSEYYDLNSFACAPCNAEDGRLQPTRDKFACECTPYTSNSIAALYDATKEWPTCIDLGCGTLAPEDISASAGEKCEPSMPAHEIEPNCKVKFINSSLHSTTGDMQAGSSKQILITSTNPDAAGNCSFCDLRYNFHYREYCIYNVLMKPYLHYNAFWQSTSLSVHFGDLKFVAFFCLGLRNATTCQQLANLCIVSHFSFDKNSPCSAFWLSQVSDVITYANMDEQMRATKPFLFYKKNKLTAQMLSEPIFGLSYDFDNKFSTKKYHFLEFFSTTFGLDGALKRWGSFKTNHVDLCHLYTLRGRRGSEKSIRFGQHHEISECSLTLEQLIELAQIYANGNFIGLFLNFTRTGENHNTLFKTVPILIEDLTPENQRNKPEEWQLVKRFQLIEAHPRRFFSSDSSAAFEDVHKLQLYRSLRYVEQFEIHYVIYEHNRISTPLVKLSYRHVELSGNSTLDEVYSFRMRITFERVAAAMAQQWWIEVVLPILLLVALATASLHTFNFSKRRRNVSTATLSATTEDQYNVACLTEFLLQLLSHMANAFLVFFLLHITCRSLQFLTQHTVQITLPLVRHEDSLLQIIIYVAVVLKLIFLAVHFWRISHFDLFFIDWERPKSYDNNHFNLKNNLETSSVCSSVRTFVSENNVSVWRIFFTANEWIRLSGKQRTSNLLQGFAVLIVFKVLDKDDVTQQDLTLKLFVLVISYSIIYMAQLCGRALLLNRIYGNPLQKYVDLCSLANISVFTLLECCYGFYIHGRSPHGFADTDMSSMILQLQRESQNMCGRRGLLSDSDQQTYVIVPPTNLRTYFEKLLIPFQRSCSISQAHVQKESSNVEGNLERTSIAYYSVNRFFCAFIDHAIKDMDYIIKEKTFVEKLFDCEFDNYFSENKGTFYIDKTFAFGQLFLYGNYMYIFTMQLLLVLTFYMLTAHVDIAIAAVCLLNKLFECIFHEWSRQNVARKTLIDKRFLI